MQSNLKNYSKTAATSDLQLVDMKKVAGKLKLTMAQYRELEAFAQFASDLDPETKNQLNRGLRVTELLKQAQYSPVAIACQIAVIYAANNGFFDTIEIKDIKSREEKFYKFMQSTKVELLQKIEKDWDEKIEAELKDVCQDFFEK